MSRVLKNQAFLVLFFSLLGGILWIEGVFHIISGHSCLSFSSIQIFLFTLVFSFLAALILQFWKPLFSKITILVIILLIGVYAVTQLNFKGFMGNYMSLSATSNGGIGRVKSEIMPFLRALQPIYFLVFVPFIAFLIFFICKKNLFVKTKWNIKEFFVQVLLLFLLHALSIFTLSVDNTALKSKIELYKRPIFVDTSLQQFGVTRFLWRDFLGIFSKGDQELIDVPKQEEPEVPVEPDFVRHIDDSKWLEMIEKETNPVIKNMHEFFRNQPITPKNEMTGKFKDKNLILVMVEAFDMTAIQKEYTPTLYKMKEEGWYFDNYYTPKYSCTTGESEFIGETSIIPSLTACTPNVYTDNNYSTSIFDVFNQNNYYSTSYHSWRDQFYERTRLHANMGSSHYYDYDSLKMSIPDGWPSDEQLFEKAYPYFKKDDQNFFSFVITSSMHFPYDEDTYISKKYANQLSSLSAPDKIKRYMAKAMDLDKGLENLLKSLEASGELDDTVIVLFGDHHPLNMELSYLNQFSNVDRFQDFNEDRMPFIIYNAKEESKVISKTSSTFDILPTLANLFDLEYDPRYYVGKDIFSEEETIVLFPNGSWITDKAMYFSNKNSYKKLQEVDDTYFTLTNQKVNNYFKISDKVLTNDYFKYRFPN